MVVSTILCRAAVTKGTIFIRRQKPMGAVSSEGQVVRLIKA